ncbi:spermidine/putrescine ABC transporter substrate-binding protein [Verrucomicrobiales bacterium]|nr:spermidine/putrescine ABC transporter substrate-binding protein [Verrucomicrobiales bacterium]
MNVITWEDYVAPEVLEAFTERTGIAVNLESFEDSEELIGRLSAYSHRYDVVIFDNASAHRVANMKLLRRLDRNRIPGMANLDQKFLNMDADPGNNYTVPYLWGSTLVAYRKDKIVDPEPSFKLLFEPNPELTGKVMMIDDPVEMFGVAHIYSGRSTNSYDKKSLAAAAETLKQQRRNLEVQYGSDKDVRDGLASGEVWAAMCYSGDAAWVAEDHEEVGYFFPKEGATLWLDIMAVARDSRNIDAAYKFINFVLEPEIGAMNANHLWYATPNAKAMPLLSEELLQDQALFPPKSVVKNSEFLRVTPEKVVTQIGRLLREVTTDNEVVGTATPEPAE